MRRPLFLLLVYTSCAYAQRAPELRIETLFQPGTEAGTSSIAVRFTNLTSHSLDLPTDNLYRGKNPPLGTHRQGLYYPHSIFSCIPVPGSLSVRFDFKPVNPEVKTVCSEVAAERWTGKVPELLRRAKSWTHLEPGASTTREANVVQVLPLQAGRFIHVSAIYRSPQFSPADQRILRHAGINVPAGVPR